jgi:NurA domain-containing protein
VLDLVAVAAQLTRMRGGLAAYGQETVPRLAASLGAWDRAAAMGPALRERVTAAKTSWLVAEPLEPLQAYDVVKPAGDYRVIASDGSQILPDRHERLPCFLVNVGVVDIDYDTSAVRLESIPQLFWALDDVFPIFGGFQQEADGRVVAARRFAQECDALRGSLNEKQPQLALMDGTLLLWWLEQSAERLSSLGTHDVKAQTFAALDKFLAAAKDRNALPAAYLSGPRTKDVISMLKVVLCTESPIDCDHCPYASGAKVWHAQLEIAGASLLPIPDRPCEDADPITDAGVFWSLLKPNQRSPRFRSAAPVTKAYEAPIDFVYLHVGPEIARLEFPAWVTPNSLEILVACVLDQCSKGRGYPVALSEAHEQAVVRAADRRAFDDLVRRQDVSRPTAKLMRKRTSVL